MSPKNKIIRLYVTFQVLFDLLIWLPVFYEIQKRFGLTDAQILLIQSLHYFSFFAFEIPTGYLADLFGYRKSMRAGAGVFAISNLLVMATPSYWGFLVHFILVALARSLISGAANAYLYEYLKHFNCKDEYKSVEGRARAYNLIAKLISWSAVGTLMNLHLMIPYLLTAVCASVAFALTFFMPLLPAELRHARFNRRLNALQDSSRVLLNLLNSPKLMWSMALGLGIFVLGRIQITFYQPILAEKSFEASSFGVLMSVMTIFEALGAWKPGWVQKRCDDLSAVTILGLMLGLSFAAIALLGAWGTLISFCIFSYIIGLVYPIQKQFLNDAITDSAHRATLLSLESMADRLISAGIIALFSGAFADESTKPVIYFSAALTGAVTLTAYLILRPKKAWATSH